MPEVDAVRALGMIGVMLFHCELMRTGWMGVWAFFVVSGFAVTSSLFGGRRRESSWPAAIGGFYMRRALRIWPLYFAFIGLIVAARLALHHKVHLNQLPWLLTFTYNFEFIRTIRLPEAWNDVVHLWTLSVEQQFYLIFPLLLLLRSRAACAIALLGVIAAAPLIRVAVGSWAVAHGWDPHSCADAVYAFGPAHFDAFAIGALIALYRAEISTHPGISHAVTILAVVVTAGCLVGFAKVGLSDPLFGYGREIIVYYIPTSIGAMALAGILAGQRVWLYLGRLPGLQLIGRISYGGYVLHLPVANFLRAAVPLFRTTVGHSQLIPHIALFVCAFSVTMVASWLSFTYFERPVSRMWSGRQRRHDVAAVAVPGGSDD